MKSILKTALCVGVVTGLMASSCNEFNNELTFHKHRVSRGSWQWVITQNKDSFLSKSIPDSLQVDGKSSKLKYRFTGNMDTLYQVGPVDVPIFFRELPLIELIP